MSQLYTPQEVADILKLKATTIRAYIRDGKLKAAKFGREYRVSKEDLEKFVEQSKQ
jgi:excisionase family DNA binding protein